MQAGASHRTKLLSVFLAFVTVLSVVAGGASAGGALADGGDGDPSVTAPSVAEPTTGGAPPPVAQFQSDELRTVDNINVWERAVLPFRTDTTRDGVATTLEAPGTLRAETSDASFDLYKDRFAVYNETGQIYLTFDATRAQESYDLLRNESVQLIAAKLEQGAAAPTDVSDLPDLLASEDTDARIALNTSLQGRGPHTLVDSPFDSGTFVYILSVTDAGDGFDQSAPDNVTLGDNEEVTLVGADVAAVQQGPSTVEAQPGRQDVVPRGGEATFDVETSDLGTDVDHTVVLINETDLQERRAVFNLTPTPTVLETNIGGFEGTSDVESGTNVLGLRRGGTNSFSGFVSFRDVVTSVDSGLEGDNLDVSYLAGSSPVDASITSVQGNSSDEITVGTSDAWDIGQYRWVHIASAHDGEATVTNGGTVDVRKSQQLDIEANTSITPRGQPVRFTVGFADGTPVENSVVSIGSKRVRTDANGVAVVKLDQEGTYTADAGLEPTADTAYINATTQIEVAPPGVSVGDVRLSPDTIRSNEPFGVDVDLANGDAIRRDVELRVKLKDGSSVVKSATGTTSLAAGEAATVSPGGLAEIYPGQGQTGEFTVEVNVSVDGGQVASVERQLQVNGVSLMEYSNQRILNSSGTQLSDGDSVEAGEPIEVIVDIQNRGNGTGPYNAALIAGPDLENDSGNFRIVSWKNGTLQVTDTPRELSFTTTLPRSADVAVVGANPPGSATIPQQVIVNQIAGVNVESLSVNETDVTYGNDVQINYTLSKDGGDPAFVPLIVDGTNVTAIKVSPSGTTSGSYTVTNPEIKRHTVSLSGDEVSFVVRGSDLVAEVNAPDTVTSERVTVEAVVSNVGGADASGVTARLQIKADDPDAEWQTLRSDTVGYASGQTGSVNETFTRKDWNYSVRVQVDQVESEPDGRLGNNLAVQAINGTPLANGTVQDVNGGPLAGTTVLSLTERDTGAYNVTGPNGEFTVPIEYNGGDQGIIYADTTDPTETPVGFERNGVPDIYALGATDGTVELVDLGESQLTDARTIDVTVVDQSGAPVGNANVTFVHDANGGNAAFTNYTTDAGEAVTGADGESGMEMPTDGTVKVLVEPPENQPRFIDQVYTRRFAPLSQDESLTIRLAEGPDLRAGVDVDSPQRIRDSPNATITVANDGLQNVTRNFVVSVTASGERRKSDGSVVSKSETYREDISSTINGREYADVGTGNVTTFDVNLTSFAKRLFPGPKRNGNVRVRAEVDVNEQVTTEIDRSNNVAVNDTLITYSDIEAGVSAPDTVVQYTDDTVLAIARNTGSTTSQQHTLDVTFPDGTTETKTVKPLAPGGRRTFSVEHTFTQSGTGDVTVEVDDNEFPRNNTATTDVSVEPMDVTIRRVATPSNVTNESSFYVEARFSSNQTENVSAVADFGGHSALDPVNPESWNDQKSAVNFTADDGANAVAWNVTASADKDATSRSINESIDITIEAQDDAIAQNTPSASDTATAATSVDVPVLRIVNTSAGRVSASGYTNAVEVDINTVNETIDSKSVTTYNHTLNVSLQAGTRGRSLSGLQYLFSYPYGCVEQTTSQMVTALRVDQYYRNTDTTSGPTTYDDRDRANDTIRQGLNKLSGRDTVVESRWGTPALSLDQHDNGAWSMWGNDPRGDLFYTMYAFEGTSSVARDSIQSERTQVRKNLSAIDFNNTVTWLDSKQQSDGSFRDPGYFLEERDSATAYVLVGLNRSEPDINSATEDTYEDVRVEGVQYLLDSQNDANGYWGGSRTNYRPQATALSVLALMSVQDEVNSGSGAYGTINENELSTAIDDGVDWLVSNNASRGNWAAYESYWGWSSTGERSRATGYAVLALHEYTGLDYQSGSNQNLTHAAMNDGVDYLLDVYERGGSFGYTTGTSVAVHALTQTGQGASSAVDVTVHVPDGNSNVTKTTTISTEESIVSVQFTDAELDYIRKNDVPVKIKLDSDVQVIVGLESQQLVKQSEYEDARGGS